VREPEIVARDEATAYGVPVSAKGVLVVGSKVLVLRNCRDEWELPGGRIDGGELLRAAVEREFQEETGLTVQADSFIDSWDSDIATENQIVRVLTFGVSLLANSEVAVSAEHERHAWLDVSSLDPHELPEGYIRSIRRATGAGDITQVTACYKEADSR
jgi:8-oxo-dGTP pyrophosphatase MutT (NUDIX family)